MTKPDLRGAAPALAVFLVSAGFFAGCGGGEEPARVETASEAALEAAPNARGDAVAPRVPLPKEERGTIDPARTGTIRGRVRFDGAPPARKEMAIGSTAGCENHPVPPLTEDVIVEKGALQNVFVHVKSGLDGWDLPPPPAQPVELDQEGCMYRPRVLGMRLGQKLVVLNSDGATHNVHARPDRNDGFNRTQPPGGAPVEWTPTKAETMIPFGCDIHPWMKSWVSVREHPWFAVSDAGGSFTISGVPPGEYTLEALHEKLGKKTGKVTLPASGTAEIEFVFSAE